MTELIKDDEFDAMINFVKNGLSIKYGEISLSFKIHDGRIASITNSVTENTIQKIKKEKESEKTYEKHR